MEKINLDDIIKRKKLSLKSELLVHIHPEVLRNSVLKYVANEFRNKASKYKEGSDKVGCLNESNFYEAKINPNYSCIGFYSPISSQRRKSCSINSSQKLFL